MEDDIVARIAAAKQRALLAGGERRIAAQHKKGKLTARERVNLLLDEGSLVEFGMLAENIRPDRQSCPGEGVMTGRGMVFGRPVFFFSQDFTMIGGSFCVGQAAKIIKVVDMAIAQGCPIIAIKDSVGARIQEGIESLATYAEVGQRMVFASGLIPSIAIIMGPCAGGAAYLPTVCDFTVMVKDTSLMMTTGPEVIKAVNGEEISSQDLGGWKMHCVTTGVSHFACENDIQALLKVRDIVNFLPLCNRDPPPIMTCEDPWDRDVPSLDTVIPDDPEQPFDVKFVIRAIVDNEDFCEVHELHAKNVVIGLARMGGLSVGIVANQPNHLSGALDVKTSLKMGRFIQFCDAYNIPIITLIDVPGFLPGVQMEANGLLKQGCKIFVSYVEATVPQISIVMRKAYGGAYATMSSKKLLTDINYAWPTAEVAVMGAKGAVSILHAGCDNPQQKELEYKRTFNTPFKGLQAGLLDDVIEPRSTRRRIIQDLRALAGKKVQRPEKKHNNIFF